MTKDAERVQRDKLKKILEENGGTEYLQQWGLDGKTDPESFKDCVPIVTHEDLESYIMRIVDGDDSPVLTGKPITTISLSSSTTRGMPKFVPFNDELVETTMQIYKTSFAYRNRSSSKLYSQTPSSFSLTMESASQVDQKHSEETLDVSSEKEETREDVLSRHRNHIQGYPSIRIFREGSNDRDDNGHRDTDSLVKVHSQQGIQRRDGYEIHPPSV